MEIATVFLISLGLAMDALAVSLGIATSDQIHGRRGKLRLAAHFGIFQSGMAALGWLVGGTILVYVQNYDHWLAFILLAYVGVNLIRAGTGNKQQAFNQDPSTGRILVLLSFATSIDAFAIGLSIALLRVPVLLSIGLIGIVTFLLSVLGLLGGLRLGRAFGKRMEVVGGAILLLIGVRVLLAHMLS